MRLVVAAAAVSRHVLSPGGGAERVDDGEHALDVDADGHADGADPEEEEGKEEIVYSLCSVVLMKGWKMPCKIGSYGVTLRQTRAQIVLAEAEKFLLLHLYFVEVSKSLH